MPSLLTVMGSAPSARNVSASSAPAGTRIRMPARSSGRAIGRFVPAISRIPLSNAPTGNPKMPLAAISSWIYAPSGPSMARWACAAVRNQNGICWTSAAGTTLPRMPPITVKNSTSPAVSIFRTAGSLPGVFLFSGKTSTSTRPRVSVRTAAHISTSRMCSGLVAVWLWYWRKENSAAFSVRVKTVSDPKAAPATNERRVSVAVLGARMGTPRLYALDPWVRSWFQRRRPVQYDLERCRGVCSERNRHEKSLAVWCDSPVDQIRRRLEQRLRDAGLEGRTGRHVDRHHRAAWSDVEDLLAFAAPSRIPAIAFRHHPLPLHGLTIRIERPHVHFVLARLVRHVHDPSAVWRELASARFELRADN